MSRMMSVLIAGLVGLAPLGAGVSAAEPSPAATAPQEVATVPGYARRYEDALKDLDSAKGKVSEGERLRRLLDANWAFRLEDEPSWATYVGEPVADDRWADLSVEATTARRRLGHRGRPGIAGDAAEPAVEGHRRPGERAHRHHDPDQDRRGAAVAARPGQLPAPWLVPGGLPWAS